MIGGVDQQPEEQYRCLNVTSMALAYEPCAGPKS